MSAMLDKRVDLELSRLARSRYNKVVGALAALDDGLLQQVKRVTSVEQQLTAVGRQLIIGAERLIRGGSRPAEVRAAVKSGVDRLQHVGQNLISASVPEDGDPLPDLLSPGSRRVEPTVRDYLQRADVVLTDAGHVARVANHAPLVLTLRQISLGDLARSWANTRLYGSAYLDILDDPYLVARDLVHESTHCWLNDLLVAMHIELESSSEQYWSPWKQSYRPEFGFVHSIASFSAVVVFLDSVAPTLPPDGREQRRLRILANAERERLIACRADVEQLRLPDALDQTLRPVFEQAVSVGA